MLQVFNFSQHHHILGDVRGVICDPFQVLGDQNEVDFLTSPLGVDLDFFDGCSDDSTF